MERARAAVREFRQIRTKAMKHRRSVVWRCGRVVVRFSDVSCRLSARFSKTNSRWPRSTNASAQSMTFL